MWNCEVPPCYYVSGELAAGEVARCRSYRRVGVGAEDSVLPDDAVELERWQPGDENHRVGGRGSLHSSRRSGDCGGQSPRETCHTAP